jgi:glycosyltransferase involved in cell wall biosynthesis
MLLAAVERMPGVRLDIAGDGDHRPDIEREIADRGLSDRVVLHGFVGEEEKLRLLQSAWLNVTASSVEGWSLVALEAAACGTPTVAMAVGGLREAVVHGSTGLLADTPEQLADAIQGLVADSAARLMMGRAAQARAEEFSWNGSARLLLNILQEEAGGLPVGSLTSQRQV